MNSLRREAAKPPDSRLGRYQRNKILSDMDKKKTAYKEDVVPLVKMRDFLRGKRAAFRDIDRDE